MIAVHSILDHLQPSGDHRSHEDRQTDDRRSQIGQVIEVGICLKASLRGREPADAGCLGPDVGERRLDRRVRKPIGVVPDESRRRAGRRETVRQHPDRPVSPGSQVGERLFAVGRKRGDDEVASAFEREHGAPALGGERVARLVDYRDRHVLELSVEGVAENREIDDRKEHRRNDQDRLAPEGQIGALADGEDSEQGETRPARDPRRRPFPDFARATGRFDRAAHPTVSSRSALPV